MGRASPTNARSIHMNEPHQNPFKHRKREKKMNGTGQEWVKDLFNYLLLWFAVIRRFFMNFPINDRICVDAVDVARLWERETWKAQSLHKKRKREWEKTKTSLKCARDVKDTAHCTHSGIESAAMGAQAMAALCHFRCQWAWAFERSTNIMFQMNTLISNRSVPLNANMQTENACQCRNGTSNTQWKWRILFAHRSGYVCAFEWNQWSVRCRSHSSISPTANGIGAIFLWLRLHLLQPILEPIFVWACVGLCELICRRRHDVGFEFQ